MSEEQNQEICEEIVHQWSVSMEGDSFEGFIYAQFEEEKWLKIPYSC